MELAIVLLIIGFVLMFFEVLLPGMVLGACAILSLIASVAVGLNLLVGYAGQVSLGHAAFYAGGAYASALLTQNYEFTPLPAMLTAAVAVGVLAWLVGQATRKLGPGYAAEILELHHAAKRDAPSGTALRLAEAIAEARGEPLAEQLVLERAGQIGERPEYEDILEMSVPGLLMVVLLILEEQVKIQILANLILAMKIKQN